MKTKLYLKGTEVQSPSLINQFHKDDTGIFESLRVYNGVIFRQEDHMRRLLESAKTSGYAFNFKVEQIIKDLKKSLKHYGKKEAFVRLTLYEDKAFVMIGERKHSEKLYKKGVVLQTSPVKRTHSNAAAPEAKTSAYQNSLMAGLEVRAPGVYEWLFLDQEGYVAEVRIGNIFIINSKQKRQKPELVTPPLQGILNGVTRRVVIECASSAGMRFAERPLTRHDIFCASEVFLTNTSWEILPVQCLDGRKIGNQIPGKLTTQLHSHFKKKVKKECQS